MQQKLFSLGVVGAMMLTFFTGCSNQGQNQTPQVAEAASSSTTDSVSSNPVSAPELAPPEKNNKAPEAPIVVNTGKNEGDSCLPVKKQENYLKSDCGDPFICVPDSTNLSKGTCRVACGKIEKNKEKKTPELCSADRSCQTATSLSLDQLGIFCLPVQTKRDGDCSALADKEACSDNRICAVSELNKDEAGQPVASSFLCRESCPFGTEQADSSCPTGEKCVSYPYESTSQTDDAGKPVMCTESKCTGDMKDCECDARNGYKCSALIPGVIAFCDRSAGICVSPVRFASVLDFDAGRFHGEKCNEIKGHAYCDNSGFAGLEGAGQSLCIQTSETSGDGFCYAYCSSPAIDLNQDGQLLGKEVGEKLKCPADFMCTTHLGRQLGFVAPIPDKHAPSGRKSCNPQECQEGVPCPQECGIGEAECLTYRGQAGNLMSFCGAPFGSCEPAMSLL